MNKKAVSPIVATSLLIGIVIILAIIIFFWARGFSSETVQKFDRAVELSCEDVNFEVQYLGNEIDVINRGNIPLYGFDVREVSSGETKVNEIQDRTLGIGDSDTISLPSSVSLISGEKLVVIPMILGETGSGKVAHTCEEKHGITLTI